MNDSVDMRATIIPKSDQLNADDLIGGPMTVEITKVARANTAEQPIAVSFVGDNGKPYMPCKSMRRVMVMVWGEVAAEYVGRSMTLYRDAEVTWGGMAVGGIRISHMSHMDKPVTMALTATKKARKPYTVEPLKVAAPVVDKAVLMTNALIDRFRTVADAQEFYTMVDEPKVIEQLAWLHKNRRELFDTVAAARKEAADRTDGTPVPVATPADGELPE
jgi:hypothetical protein